jgi:uroporphyrinogen decarboxylase
MTDQQWRDLLAVIRGERVEPLPVGFIIDSPWLPGWCGMAVADYISGENAWFEANRRAIETFPEFTFIPGFWAEFGMCTEPSAFGARCIFPRDAFPYAERMITDEGQILGIREPDPATDGLLPLVLNRLRWARPRIEEMGNKIRFSVSRGPLNIASFLMGMTEFLVALKTEPGAVHRLLGVITGFLRKWHLLQRETFPTIDGILILDDVVGFMGEADFMAFGFPYLKELFAPDAAVRFFHNDAPCAASVGHYADMGVNVFNPGIQTPIAELRRLCNDRLTLFAGIPPRDVLAQGSPSDVFAAVSGLLAKIPDRSRLILSCGGGMPPGVTTENLRAFLAAARGGGQENP